MEITQKMIPATNRISDIESLVHNHFEYMIMLQIHISQLTYVVDFVHRHKKKILLHADLIQGLKADEAGAQYLCQDIKPDGLISTHAQVITTAKKRGLLAVQRIFLIDSHSLETSYRVIQSAHPDYIEVLPGIMPSVIRDVCTQTKLPVFAGGFLHTTTDVKAALAAGASSVTTSDKTLWSLQREL
ncbi:glycerol-3-phosphate responsive antiterminator [Sulfoacidibacillus ferrooxidans]|uniref:Glycerol uptake operon antiterminator regulatory protein n=1 Tax=Sulfoacidibacillus ferrooxidans TaxID=2005001 RepID=A0A9X2AFS9_9BACL|nr:glycerol-3-phosphate responsive antiterminator [Sulfoacidibacillus ferrooxidans]MCI0184361.1 Glycerol uptake operon antiterminator regulatory protein [Sulfoacidibacillus ferrooxidans]